MLSIKIIQLTSIIILTLTLPLTTIQLIILILILKVRIINKEYNKWNIKWLERIHMVKLLNLYQVIYIRKIKIKLI